MRHLCWILVLALSLPCLGSGSVLIRRAGGGGGGGATDYTSDGSLEAYYFFEDASGGPLLDGHANSNDVTCSSDGSGPTQTATPKEGTYSWDYESTNNENCSLADASLSAGFPAKSSGGHTSDISVGCWVRMESDINVDIVKKGDTLQLNHLSTASWDFRFGVNDSTWIYSDTDPTADGTTWYHVVGVFDDTNDQLLLYVNGASDATPVAFASAASTNVDPWYVGGPADMDGLLDECFIFSRVLSATEVCEICRYGLDGAESDRTCGSCTLP